MTAVLRPIRREDDAAVARLIRAVMPEFGAVGRGFAIEDAEVDAMYESYAAPRSAFWVLEASDGAIIGGGGYAPLAGADASIAELRKMYFLSAARGGGHGRALMELCLAGARADGFTRVYLETLTTMHAAQRLYERFGFTRLTAPRGATGHHGCNVWMELEL